MPKYRPRRDGNGGYKRVISITKMVEIALFLIVDRNKYGNNIIIIYLSGNTGQEENINADNRL